MNNGQAAVSSPPKIARPDDLVGRGGEQYEQPARLDDICVGRWSGDEPRRKK